MAAREVLGKEGVEEGVSHADGRPGEPDEGCGETECLGLEQRTDSVFRELPDLLLDEIDVQARAELLYNMRDAFILFGASDEIQDFRGEPGLSAVSVGDAVDDRHGLLLPALVQEELWRLEKMEAEEAQHKHGKRDDANRHDKVPPALLDGPVAHKVPRDQRRDELAKRPPHAEQGEQRAGRVGQELEEQGAVDGQAAADAEAQGGEEEAHAGPRLGVGGHDAEDAGDEERHVEGDAAAQVVGADAPDGAAEGEAQEERAGRVAHGFLLNVEFGGEGGEGEGDALGDC